MRLAPMLMLLPLSLPAWVRAQTDQQKLVDEVQRLEAEYGGHTGFMAKNLKTGETLGYNATERFPTASVIKLPVMAAFFDMVDRKEVDPNTWVILTEEDKKQGSGILQFLSGGTTITLLDTVRLMMVLSDNTATNLVLDRLAPTHAERMARVNDCMVRKGLNDTRILNRLYTLATKQQTPEGIRYGIGVSTPEDMVKLLEGLYTKTLVQPASCDAMLAILKQQFYGDMIPRLLPREGCKRFETATKSGFINETKVDVGLVLSDKADIALAIFVDKHPDHRDIFNNRALLLAASVSRAVWNHFTGDSGYGERPVPLHGVDWTSFPGGRWAIYRSNAALFPHKSRDGGFQSPSGSFFPYHPHYDDNSIVVVVPDGFQETPDGTNVIVHFHGHMNDSLGVLERYGMPQALASQKINALLVLAQGPYRARDSAGGKMEDEGGFKTLVDDVLSTMKDEEVVKTARLHEVIVSAHSGGYRPAAFALERGGLGGQIPNVFLFDAFYGEHERFSDWLTRTNGRIRAAYTDHLQQEHVDFEKAAGEEVRKRLSFIHTNVDHDQVIQNFFSAWLAQLDKSWKLEGH